MATLELTGIHFLKTISGLFKMLEVVSICSITKAFNYE